MKKGDIGLIIVAVVFLALWLIPKGQGGEAAIYVDGKLYERLPLDRDCKITVQSQWGENTVRLEDGVVTVNHCDCPDKLCEKEKISASGGSIVCLPNRLSVIIENTKSKNKTDVIL